MTGSSHILSAVAASVDPRIRKDWAEDWAKIKADGDIQFAPFAPTEPPKPPAWLEAVQKWLENMFGPVGESLAGAWPVLRWVLLGIAAVLVVVLVWRLVAPLSWRRTRRPDDEGWIPDQTEALTLLEDADALAAAGRFDEATHLLLMRSVGQIRAARPDWLEPSSTTREIAALPALPETARTAFAVIAERVERSLFALMPLGQNDWQTARDAYARFALADLDRAQA